MSRIILALDRLDWQTSLRLTCKLKHLLYGVKIHSLVDVQGPSVIRALQLAGAQEVFVDHKINDIPETAATRVAALAAHGATAISVHASGGLTMLRAAVSSAGGAKIYAVTALSSLDTADTQCIFGRTPEATVLELARLAKQAGVHGIICSPQEVKLLADRREFTNTLLITPGVRHGTQNHDQSRTTTPHEAIANGASLIVVGREVTTAPDPIRVLERIAADIADKIPA